MLRADTSSLRKLGSQLRKSQPAMYRATQKGLRVVGDRVAKRATTNAEAFSTRIPPTVKSRVSGLNSVIVSAGGTAAPNAKPIENHGKGHVRHPVFGDREAWTDKNSPPAFLLPAATADLSRDAEAVAAALQVQVEKILHGQDMWV